MRLCHNPVARLRTPRPSIHRPERKKGKRHLEIFFHRTPDTQCRGEARWPVRKLVAGTDRADVDRIVMRIEHESCERGESRHAMRLRQPLERGGAANPHRAPERSLHVIGKACQLPMQRSVLVNKCAWLGTAGVKKQHASEILGTYLAGFVPEAGASVREAQNRGVLPAEAGRDKPIQAALRKILAQD